MKMLDSHNHLGWAILVVLFGVFFLIGNLLPPESGVLRFWPIFLIAAGIYKGIVGCVCCKSKSH